MEKHAEPMTGCIVHNFHEGTRSEYLAQYFFSSLGTAVPVPHPEDTGLDLHCTITKQIGNRAWPRCFYSVQIKSKWAPWAIGGDESVNWLLNQPSPLFLCVVEKKQGRFRIYQTVARHSISAQPPLPRRIELIPEDSSECQPTPWKRDTEQLNLGAPILDFKLPQFLDESYAEKAKEIITEWVMWDNDNIHLKNSGILNAILPIRYTTNERIDGTGRRIIGTIPHDERMLPAIENVCRSLEWLATCMWQSGNNGLAVRVALLLRRLGSDCIGMNWILLKELCRHFGQPDPVHLNDFPAGLDVIDAAIEELLPSDWRRNSLPSMTDVAKAKKLAKGNGEIHGTG